MASTATTETGLTTELEAFERAFKELKKGPLTHTQVLKKNGTRAILVAMTHDLAKIKKDGNDAIVVIVREKKMRFPAAVKFSVAERFIAGTRIKTVDFPVDKESACVTIQCHPDEFTEATAQIAYAVSRVGRPKATVVLVYVDDASGFDAVDLAGACEIAHGKYLPAETRVMLRVTHSSATLHDNLAAVMKDLAMVGRTPKRHMTVTYSKAFQDRIDDPNGK